MRIIRKTPLAKNRKLGISAFVLPVLLATVFLLPGCNMFNKPLSDFLEYWTDVAQINRHSFDGSYPATGGKTNLPSGGDRVITCYVINPQNYVLTPSATFASGSLTQGSDYSIEQDASDRTVLRLTLNDSYLQTLDGDGTEISPTVSITEPNSGRTFGSYTVPVRVNSAPNKAKNAVIMTWDDDTVYKYAVLFYLPEDTNNQYSPDRDVVSMTVSGFSGKYNTTFEIPASGDIGGVENAYAQGVFSPVDSGDSFIPLSGYRFVGIKTDFVVGDVVPSCTITLRDSSGLESTTDVSTTTTKLTEIYVDPTNGNDSYTGSDLLPVATVGKAMEKLSGMTNTTIILVGDVDVQNTLAFTASYPNITLKGGATPVTLTYSGTGRAITVSGGKLTLGENITITGADDGAVEITGGEFVMETGSTLKGNGESPGYDPLATPPNGGAVCVRGGTFTMKGGTINSNEASSGGAVYVDGGSFTMSGGTISNNEATSGGGVSVRAGSFTMNGTDAKIQRNEASQAPGGGPGMGGGVQVGGGTFTITDGTISDNKVWEGEGGGVHVSGGNVSVSGGAIRTNTAKTVGGGVCITGGSVEIAGSVTIEQNIIDFFPTVPGDSVPAGRDIYFGGFESTFTISGGNILGQGNKKEIYSANTFTITGNPTITDCTVTLEQGALINVQGLNASALSSVQVNLPVDFYAENKVLLEKANSKDICGKFALDNPPSNGVWWIGPENGNGVLKTIEGTYDESTNTITVPTMPGTKDELQNTVNGSAESGVKVEITGGGNIDIDSTVSVPDGADVAIKPGNGSAVNINADGDTTAFNVSGGELTLGGGGGTVTVDGGEETDRNGSKSLITVGTGGTLNITTGATIQNNKMSSGSGGGIVVSGGGTVNMDGGSIKNCQSSYLAGGIYVINGTFNMSNGIIDGCFCTGGSVWGGGGVTIGSQGIFNMSGNATIQNCRARIGGGVYVDGGTFNMSGGKILKNAAEGSKTGNAWGGGGVFLTNSSTNVFKLTGGYIQNNNVEDTFGGNSPAGGISVQGGTFYCVINNIGNSITISGNQSYRAGGGVGTLGPDDVYIRDGVLYATTENGTTKALTADITTVDGLSSPTY